MRLTCAHQQLGQKRNIDVRPNQSLIDCALENPRHGGMMRIHHRCEPGDRLRLQYLRSKLQLDQPAMSIEQRLSRGNQIPQSIQRGSGQFARNRILIPAIEQIEQQRIGQVVFGGEVSIEGSHPHAGACRNFTNLGLQTVFVIQLVRGFQNPRCIFDCIRSAWR